MTHRRTVLLIATAVAALPQGAAALWDGRVELFATHGREQDDNLFRAEASAGEPVERERYSVTTAGATYNLELGSQRLQGDLAVDRSRYDRFSGLDHDGHDGRVSWLWRMGDRFDGSVGYRDQYMLGSFDVVLGGIDAGSVNFIDLADATADAAVKVAARWELHGALSRREQKNSSPEFTISDASIERAEAGFSYLTPVGSRLGVRLRSEGGDLPNLQVVNGIAVDNSYDQQHAALVLDWAITEQSRFNASVGRVARDYQGTLRDYDDNTFSAAYDWRSERVVSFSVLAERDISADEELNVGFIVIERLAVLPTFRIGDNLELTGTVEHSNRTYLGDPQVLIASAAVREAVVRGTGVALVWRPVRVLSMRFAWRNDSRDANFVGGSYDTTRAGVSLRVSF